MSDPGRFVLLTPKCAFLSYVEGHRAMPSRRITIAVLLIGALIIGLGWFFFGRGRRDESLQTAAVRRGDLTATISASGTLQPERVIDVGAQVAGRIVRLGTDSTGKMIDYGSFVEQGMILAYIDDSLHASDASTAQAQLENARAGVMRAEADVEQLKARFNQSERDWKRAKELGPSDALSQADFDAAQANYETAKAAVDVGRASIRQAKSAVDQADAQVRRAQQNLSYCIIRSPIRGVIIDRRVNIGQTVVSSLNAPSLFLIAQDLTRMQVWVPVNEADIGSIQPRQKASFTVDARQGETFEGDVAKIRLNAQMTQNVVTYTVEINTSNAAGRLLPYLTANVKFLIGQRKNVLIVPNSALRWAPSGQIKVLDAESPDKSAASGAKGGPVLPSGTIWVMQKGKPAALPVRIGLNDGMFTEITAADLKEGTEIVVGGGISGAGSQSGSGQVSPFVPNIGRGRRP